jgi:hypothetical protein
VQRKAADEHHRKLFVVSHSWGTVLSYLAMATDAVDPQPTRVDLLINLSSPLGTGNVDFLSAGWCFITPDPINCVNAEQTANGIHDVIRTFTDGWRAIVNPQSLKPRAGAVWNFWAWGDFVSGPLNSLHAVAAQAGSFVHGSFMPPGGLPSRGALSPAYASLDGGSLDVVDVLVDSDRGASKFSDSIGQRYFLNLATTDFWHGYDSLKPRVADSDALRTLVGDSDNTVLRAQVEALIRTAVSSP